MLNDKVAKYTLGYDGLFHTVEGFTSDAINIGLSTIPSSTLDYVLKVARARAEFERELSMLDLPFVKAALPTKIDTIKRVRDDLGVSLKDAKHFVDFIWALLV